MKSLVAGAAALAIIAPVTVQAATDVQTAIEETKEAIVAQEKVVTEKQEIAEKDTRAVEDFAKKIEEEAVLLDQAQKDLDATDSIDMTEFGRVQDFLQHAANEDERLSNRLDDLESEIAYQKGEQARLIEERKVIDQETGPIVQAKTQAQQEADAIRASIKSKDDLQAAFDDAEADYNAIYKIEQELIAEVAQLTQQDTTATTELQTKVAEATTKHNQVKLEVEQAQTDLSVAEKALEDARKDGETAPDGNVAGIQAAEQQVTTITERLRQKDQELLDAKDELALAEQNLAGYIALAPAKQAELDRIQERLAVLSSKTVKAKEELDAFDVENPKKLAALAEKEAEFARLDQEHAKKQTEWADKSQELSDVISRINDFEKELNTNFEELKTLRDEATVAREQFKEMSEKRNARLALQEKVFIHTENIAGMMEELVLLEEAAIASLDDLNAANEKLGELIKHAEELEALDTKNNKITLSDGTVIAVPLVAPQADEKPTLALPIEEPNVQVNPLVQNTTSEQVTHREETKSTQTATVKPTETVSKDRLPDTGEATGLLSIAGMILGSLSLGGLLKKKED